MLLCCADASDRRPIARASKDWRVASRCRQSSRILPFSGLPTIQLSLSNGSLWPEAAARGTKGNDRNRSGMDPIPKRTSEACSIVGPPVCGGRVPILSRIHTAEVLYLAIRRGVLKPHRRANAPLENGPVLDVRELDRPSLRVQTRARSDAGQSCRNPSLLSKDSKSLQHTAIQIHSGKAQKGARRQTHVQLLFIEQDMNVAAR